MKKMGEYQHIRHTFEPVYSRDSRVLILGSLPSVKSRKQGFYYGHPQNRFWKVLSALLCCDEPVTIEEKKRMLLSHQIAVWDVIDNCDIIGSSDSSIRNVAAADIPGLLRRTEIKRVYANGKTAEKLYNQYIAGQTGMQIIPLPSTSPANAAFSVEKLTEAWRVILGGRAVVFDMDGVIFDSERLVLECWSEIADRRGIENIEEAMRECLGVNAVQTKEIMLRRYGREFPYDAFRKEASALFHERYDGGRLPLKKGVRELLSYLKDRGIKIALASSTREKIVRQELSDAGILDYFEQVICGDMVERSKPAPDIYLKACEALGVTPAEAYAVEDSYNGIRSANAAGLLAIMVPDLSEPTPEMERLAVRILPDLAEVVRYMDKTLIYPSAARP